MEFETFLKDQWCIREERWGKNFSSSFENYKICTPKNQKLSPTFTRLFPPCSNPDYATGRINFIYLFYFHSFLLSTFFTVLRISGFLSRVLSWEFVFTFPHLIQLGRKNRYIHSYLFAIGKTTKIMTFFSVWCRL